MFGEFGKGGLLPNRLPSKDPARKCVLDGGASLDLLLGWRNADGEAPMEGMSLLLPVRAAGSDVIGGLIATDRAISRGSLILRVTVGGCGLCFFLERNHGSVVLVPKRMMAMSDMVETRLRGTQHPAIRTGNMGRKGVSSRDR